MRIDVMRQENSVRCHVSGDIDESGAAEMKHRFEQLDLANVREVIFNFQEVAYIGSAGLGKLLLFYKKLSMQNVTMTVEHPSSEVRDILTELRLDSLFAVV